MIKNQAINNTIFNLSCYLNVDINLCCYGTLWIKVNIKKLVKIKAQHACKNNEVINIY